MAKTQTAKAAALSKAELEKELADIERRALDGLEGVRDPDGLAARMQTFLGRNGEMNRALEHLVDLPKAERAEVGRRANELKAHLETAFAARREAIEAALLEGHLREEALDVTLPGRPVVRGRVHPAHWMIHQITKIWAEMGFQVYLSPRGRDRRVQLHLAQHAAAPPGPRHVGHVPHHRPAGAAAHAHLAGADPRHARARPEPRSA